MHPELWKERLDLCPPECQLYVLHSDAQPCGEQKLLCVTAFCFSLLISSFVFDLGICFWRWATVGVQRLWWYHENNKDLSSAIGANQRDYFYNADRSDATKFCADKSNKATSTTFDMRGPELFVQSDFSAFHGKIWSWSSQCVTHNLKRGGRKGATDGKTVDRKASVAAGYPTCGSGLSTNCRGMERGLEGNMLLCNIVPGALCYPYMPSPLGQWDKTSTR